MQHVGRRAGRQQQAVFAAPHKTDDAHSWSSRLWPLAEGDFADPRSLSMGGRTSIGVDFLYQDCHMVALRINARSLDSYQ